jgi:Acyl-CoA dehydrogenase, C-terminal domain/Acyl-CoA dehydrogenase, N-terminal domain
VHFGFDDDQLAFRDAVRALLDKECPPEAVRSAGAAAPGLLDRGVWDQLASMGVLAMLVPEDRGGLGLDERSLVLILEEAGRCALPHPLVDTAAVAAPLLGADAGMVATNLGGPHVPCAADADRLLLHDPGDSGLHLLPRPDTILTPVATVDHARRAATVTWDPSAPAPADLTSAWHTTPAPPPGTPAATRDPSPAARPGPRDPGWNPTPATSPGPADSARDPSSAARPGPGGPAWNPTPATSPGPADSARDPSSAAHPGTGRPGWDATPAAIQGAGGSAWDPTPAANPGIGDRNWDPTGGSVPGGGEGARDPGMGFDSGAGDGGDGDEDDLAWGRGSWDLGAATLVTDDPEVVELARDRGAWGTAAMLVGLGQRMIELAVAHVTERHQFGVPVGSFQAVKHQLADAHKDLAFARPVVHRAAHSLATGAADRGRDVSMAKALAGDAAWRAGRVALQCHGAIGYTVEHDLHLYLKRTWALAKAYGDAGWHRDRVARAVGI